jgi:hypothetical protein
VANLVREVPSTKGEPSSFHAVDKKRCCLSPHPIGKRTLGHHTATWLAGVLLQSIYQ